MNKFGITLKKLMSRDRVSVAELAKAIGEPQKTIQEWVGERGRSPRDLNCIPKLAQFFRVSTHYLLFGEEDPNNIISNILEKTEVHTGLYEITVRKVKEKSGKK